MSGKLLQFAGDPHHEALRLLPWRLNGTLDADECAFVDGHVRDCARCRSELDALRIVQETCLREDEGTPPAFARLRARIEAGAGPAPADPPRWSWRRLRAGWGEAPAWLRAAACVQAALLVAVALAWPAREPAPRPYRTLGNGAFAGVAAPSEATLLLVLAPDVDQAQTRRLLRASGARIVDGPSDVGAYVVAVDAKRASASRDALRAAPGVQMVETLDSGPRR